MKLEDLITETTIYEAYFDLWGFTVNWIETIGDKLMDFAMQGKGDHCEVYTCEACMAVRFQSTDQGRVKQAKRIFLQFAWLAQKASLGKPSEVCYTPVGY